MKTFIYLPTLLAFTIQVMVNGQTPGNQVRKIRVDIFGAKQHNMHSDTTQTITISLAEYHQLLEQANYQKNLSMKEEQNHSSFDQQLLLEQLEASELSARHSIQKFEQNREIILDLLNRTPKNNYMYTRARLSNTDAEYLMRLALEMREEANAQITLQAKVGEMSNAEEKEVLALNKQKEVLDMFKKIPSQIILNTQPTIDQVAHSDNHKNDVNAENHIQFVTEEFRPQNSDLIYELLTEIENIRKTAKELRIGAERVALAEKTAMIAEAISLENDYLLKQIEVSEIKAKFNSEYFSHNKQMISALIENIKGNNNVVNKAIQLNTEAEHLMKIGKEMREEANAQLYLAAKYGEMSNAEEKEILAINKQQEAVQIIYKTEHKMILASK